MKKFRFSYVIIPLIILVVALWGQYLTMWWMERYTTLQLPNFTPLGWSIWIIRFVIFALGVISTVLFWCTSEHDKKFGIAISLFVDNAILNVLRSRLFFTKHLFLWSIIEMIVLFIVTVMMIIAVRPRSRRSAYLLIPYASWLVIATIFAIKIYLLN